MATKKTTIETIHDALDAELSAGPQPLEGDELTAYLDGLSDIIDQARAVRKLYAKKVAVLASQKSRAARKERVEKALALLAEQEAAQATDAA